MEIEVKLIHGSFIFIDKFSIKKSDGKVKINLSDKSDAFLRTVASSILCGVLQSDSDVTAIVGLIRDVQTRSVVAASLGLQVSLDVLDTMDAPAEIISDAELESADDVVDETVDEQDESEQDESEQEETAEEDSGDNLKGLLTGNTKAIYRKIVAAKLDQAQKAKLVEIEESSRNRTSVISVIKES
jgi:hypothetical protein